MSNPSDLTENDIADIMAKFAAQEEAEKATQRLLDQEAVEEATRKFLEQEADAKIARELSTQLRASNSSSSSSSSSSIAQGLAPLKTSTQEVQTNLQPEKEVKINSDKPPIDENDDIAAIMAKFKQLETDAELARKWGQSGDKKTASESSNALSDYEFALTVQYGQERMNSKPLQHDIKTADEDAELVRALQAIEDEGAASLSVEMLAIYDQLPKRWEGKSTEERKKIEESLKVILVSPAVAGEQGTTDLTNAHKFTSTLIRAGIPVLTNIDDQFKLSSIELTPDQVLKEVLEFLEKLQKEGIESRISIENIKKTFEHIQSNAAVDASETQANAHHLLSRTWFLAKTMGRDYMIAVASLLSDNIGDGGSCIPGLIARLYPPYAKMLAIYLGVEVAALKPAAKTI